MNNAYKSETSSAVHASAQAGPLSLTLADGTQVHGQGFGAIAAVQGEVVFNTGMSGYVETLTDPSYRGQILVFTYPLVGNYGVPAPRRPGTLDAPYESDRIQVRAVVVQTLKALREEGIFTVLVNPNIATIQMSPELVDRIHFVAVTPEFVEQIIVKESVDAILLSFGGQTALNCGLALHDSGVLAKHGVQVLGTPIQAIRDTEDRQLFVERLAEIGVATARSRACATPDEARAAIREIGLPAMLRSGYALGGKGSGIVRREADVDAALKRAFGGGATQILVEECLEGWKEIEYEVVRDVRDVRDNCICVCNMENFDPMGIHTGDSIVVAPSQTLNDAEY